MACKTSYAWSHNFPRLAVESGFSFSFHRPRVVLDWNGITTNTYQLQRLFTGLLDIENLIRDRNFQLVEQHINDVVECTLESEFDVRILDAGVVKLFRLAQLAVEYQQFCRQYLDRSVVVLRDELTAAMQELEKIKKEIRTKDDEIRRLRRKTKGAHRTVLPYGNENIATMILRTLSNRGDILAGTSIGEAVPQYNKCQYCDKVFLNQLYLQSHMSRRHPALNEQANINEEIAPKDLPEKISPNHNYSESTHELEIAHLRNEVKMLQDKLSETELALNVKERNTNENKVKTNNEDCNTDENINEKLLIEKFEQWKNQENGNYRMEINELRNQLMDYINSFKDAAALTNASSKDNEIIEQLRATVKNQETQINVLKEQLTKVNNTTKTQPEITEVLQKQDHTWQARMDQLKKQHEQKLDQLLRTLETVYKEVKAAREVAETEKAKVVELENLLMEKDNMVKNLQQAKPKDDGLTRMKNPYNSMAANRRPSIVTISSMDEMTSNYKPQQHISSATSKGTFDDLHRKAQELLCRNPNSDSELSDSAAEIFESPGKKIHPKNVRKTSHTKSETRTPLSGDSQISVARVRKNKKKIENREKAESRSSGDSMSPKKGNKTPNKAKNSRRRSESEGVMDLEGVSVKASPTKVIRAKLSEEVNNRLMQLGVEPLKSGVPSDTFNERQSLLQHNAQQKAKKDATYGKMRNRIMTFLDSKVSKETEQSVHTVKISPSKQPKTKGSFFSSVKNKAMSFMKPSDKVTKVERNNPNEDIAKRAAELLKTPPGSGLSSPEIQRRTSVDSRSLFPERVKRALTRMTSKESPVKTPPKSQSVEVLYNRNDKTHKSTDTGSEDSGSESTSSLGDFKNGHAKKNGVKVVTSAIAHEPSKSIENLINSPIRRPSSEGERKGAEYSSTMKIFESSKSGANLPPRPVSATPTSSKMYSMGTDSDDDDSDVNIPDNHTHKFLSEENLLTRSSPTSTKGVLKNAPSISSLSKKKVLFDLEATQMKSVSTTSQSQSVTEGNNDNVDASSKVIRLSNDWEVSSIEDVPVREMKPEETFTVDSRRSPKIAELTQRIESQLARRGEVKKPTGAVEVMSQNPSATNILMDGSNTSVGSSLLDDSNLESEDKRASPKRSKTPIPAPRYVSKSKMDKDASDLDVSDWSIDDILKGK